MSWIRQTNTIYTHCEEVGMVPPTSSIVHGLSFSWSQPGLRVFLWLLQFSSLFKMDSQWKKKKKRKQLAWVLCSRIIHDCLMATIEVPFIYIQALLLSCALCNSAPGLQVRMISRHYYYYYYYYYYGMTQEELKNKVI